MLSGESCVRFLHDASSARSRNRMRQIVGKIVPSKSPFIENSTEKRKCQVLFLPEIVVKKAGINKNTP